jgi:hypothetical protein
MRASSTIKETDTLEDSVLVNNIPEVATLVPALNIALSGSTTGGLKRGITTLNAESRHFKTLFALVMAKAYLDKHKEAVLLFYDSEFGAGKSYFTSLGIDPNRVLHTPVEDIEFLLHDVMVQLDAMEKNDKVIIVVDSIGGLGSRKEATDALDGKDTTDMTRAKRLKSVSRLLPVRLVKNDVPMILINHVYKTMEMYAKTIIGGGTGLLLASDVAFIITRAQEKDDKTKEILGYDFNLTVEKSRYVAEKSKISIQVRFDGGINIYSGLLELALESKHVTKPKQGQYQLVDPESGEILSDIVYKEKDTNCDEFFGGILKDPRFNKFVEEKYKLSYSKLLEDSPQSVTVEFKSKTKKVKEA